jgi:hypothetical protein
MLVGARMYLLSVQQGMTGCLTDKGWHEAWAAVHNAQVRRVARLRTP